MSLQIRVLHPEGDAASAAAPEAPVVPTDAPVVSEAPVAPPSEDFGYQDTPGVDDADMDIFAREEAPIASPAPEPEPVPAPSTPEPSVAAAPVPAATPEPARAEPAPEPAPVAAVPPEPAAPSTPGETPEQQQQRWQEQRTQWRKTTEDAATKAFEPIIAEHANDLLTNPEKVLPKLAGRLFVDVLEAAQQAIATMVPPAVQQMQSAEAMQRQAVTQAKQMWPELFPEGNAQESSKRYDALRRHAWSFRMMDRAAPADAILRKAGAAAMVELGLSRTTSAAPPVEQTQAAVVPFRPGGTGGRTAPAPSSPSKNVFEQLADEFLMDDKGP